MKENKRREGFSSGLAAFFATLSSAVGLGNIWKFPYVVGENGGAAFLLVYFVCIMFVGLPVMVSEFFIGRKAKKNVMGAIEELTPKKAWKSIGGIGILGAYLIMFFYTGVAGWVYSYVFKAIKGDFNGATAEAVQQQFGSTIGGTVEPVMWQVLVLAVVSTILIGGVKNGIEKITKTLMPVLFILILVCDIRALTLPGIKESLSFLFRPDFSNLTRQGVLVAMGLAFFKLSLGMGTMVTYGSYFTKEDNMFGTAAKVAISDTIVSLLVGIAVFSAVFTFKMTPSEGPGLLFVTIPLVFSKIPFGKFLIIAFFVLASIAATTATISMFEVLIAYYTEQKGVSRKKAVIFNAIIIALLGAFATLSVGETALLANVKIYGKSIFDLFDFIASNILLPLGGLLVALLVGYGVSKDSIKEELSNGGKLNNGRLIDLYYIILRYVTPVLLIVVFLSSFGII